MKIVRSNQEIAELEDTCWKAEEEGSKFPGMTYEQGIDACLRWLRGDEDDNPMSE